MKFRQNLDEIQINLDRFQTEFGRNLDRNLIKLRANLDDSQMEFRWNLDEIQIFLDILDKVQIDSDGIQM